MTLVRDEPLSLDFPPESLEMPFPSQLAGEAGGGELPGAAIVPAATVMGEDSGRARSTGRSRSGLTKTLESLGAEIAEWTDSVSSAEGVSTPSVQLVFFEGSATLTPIPMEVGSRVDSRTKPAPPLSKGGRSWGTDSNVARLSPSDLLVAGVGAGAENAPPLSTAGEGEVPPSPVGVTAEGSGIVVCRNQKDASVFLRTASTLLSPKLEEVT